jgi:hypothetical protein
MPPRRSRQAPSAWAIAGGMSNLTLRVFDDFLLLAIDPDGQDGEQKLPGLENEVHGRPDRATGITPTVEIVKWIETGVRERPKENAMHALFAGTPVDDITRDINEDGCLATAAVAVGLVLLVFTARGVARGVCRLFGRVLVGGLPTAILAAAVAGAAWGGLVEFLISQYTGNGLREGWPWVVVFGVLYGVAGGGSYLAKRATLPEPADKAKEAARNGPEGGAPS